MKVSISPTKTLQLHALLNNVATLVPVITLQAMETRLKMQGMDCCQVCLFECWFNSEWFDQYEASNSDCKHVNSRTLATVLKMVAKDHKVTLELCEDSLIINLFGSDVSCNKAFDLPLMATDYEPVDIGNILLEETTAEMCMTSKKFSELVNQFELFDEILTFNLSESTVELSASGDAGSMSAALDVEEGHLLEYEIVEDTVLEQSFSHRFVKSMASFSSMAAECDLLFYASRPMFIIYKIACAEDEDKTVLAKLVLMLAPRVE